MGKTSIPRLHEGDYIEVRVDELNGRSPPRVLHGVLPQRLKEQTAKERSRGQYPFATETIVNRSAHCVSGAVHGR